MVARNIWFLGMMAALLSGGCSEGITSPRMGKIIGVVLTCDLMPFPDRQFEIVPISTESEVVPDGVTWSTGSAGQLSSRPIPFGQYQVILPGDDDFAEVRVAVDVNRVYDSKNERSAIPLRAVVPPAPSGRCPTTRDHAADDPEELEL